MVLSNLTMHERAEYFVEVHHSDTYEKGQAQMYWRDFFHIFGVDIHEVVVFEEAVKKFDGSQGFIDVFWKGKLLIEHKYTSDDSGYVTVKFTKLAQAQKIVVTNPVSNESKTININVVSRFSGASDVVMYYFDGSKFKVKVIGDDGNAVGKNQVVTISLNKKTYRVKTDEKGFAVLKIPNTVKPGKYQLAVTYKGQTIKKTVKVKQNLKTKKYTVRKSAKKLIIKATLKNGKKAVKNKKLILKIKGKKIAAKTNKNGVAKFTIKKNVIKRLKVGKKYAVKISYLKNTIKTTVKVKR